MARAKRLCAALLLAGTLAACATSGGNPADPLEPFNRAMFRFNDAVDGAVIKPVAKGYRSVVPGILRTGISNFFSNLEDVWISVNDVLQGKFQRGFEDFTRVLFNSTFGIAGVFDFASDLGLQKHNEDFGQTLGWWGVGSGAYLVLPILGPSTFSGSTGFRCTTRSMRRAGSAIVPTSSMPRALLNRQRSTNTPSCAKPGCSADATLSTTEIRRGSARSPMMNPPSD